MKLTLTSYTKASAKPSQQLGLSLIELMVSITIGMLVVAALLALYLNITRTNNEMAKANRMIENGRFAIQLLQNDLSHAGFWGELDYTIVPTPSFATPTVIPDPCVVSGWTPAQKDSLIAIPVQGYADDSQLADCGVTADSNVLVVRHANTCPAGGACDGGGDTGPHIQVSNCRTGATPEAMYVIDSSPTSLSFTLRNKSCATADVAVIRKIVSNIYYLGTSNGQPTLMRTSLENGDYITQPLIEGIEAFEVEYGIDTKGKNGMDVSATNPPDGSADSYITCPTAGCSLDELGDVVAVKVHVLARNLEATPGYTDSKSYRLGGTIINAADLPAGFKRHVFSTTVRLVNPSGRREAP